MLVYSGWLTLVLPALSFLGYSALIGGMLLAWRFHSSRIFFALVVLFLAEEAIAVFGGAHLAPGTAGWTAVQAVAILVPLDFVLIAVMQERGFTIAATVPVALFLFVQSVIVAVLCRAAQGLPSPAPRAHHLAASVSVPVAIPGYALVVFAGAGLLLLGRFLFIRKPVDSALLWSLSSFFLALRFAGTTRVSTIYSATAACILALRLLRTLTSWPTTTSLRHCPRAALTTMRFCGCSIHIQLQWSISITSSASTTCTDTTPATRCCN